MTKWKLNKVDRIRENLTQQQENDIRQLYKDVYNQTRRRLRTIPAAGTVSQQIERSYLQQLARQINDGYQSIGADLEAGIRQAMADAAAGVVEGVNGQMELVGARTLADFTMKGAFSHVPFETVAVVATGQLYQGNWTLSKAVWKDLNKSQADINRIVAQGIAANRSAYDIAKDLEKYVNPAARKPWDWSKVYPGTSKKVDYNAQRLARTMVAHAYQWALERMCEKNPFVMGYQWLISNAVPGHGPACEICRARATDDLFGYGHGIFPKGELPLDHPNGKCVFVPVMLMGPMEMSNRLADWALGKSRDPELDAWYNDAYQR